MWALNNKRKGECERACNALEASTGADERVGVASLGPLLSRLPAELREHVRDCEACRTFADELAEARAILATRGNRAEPGPFFLARVMASIAATEAEIESKAQTWAAVPRLAPRLAVLASLGLLIAATWVYQMPSSTVASSVAQQWAGLTDAGAPQDDLLVSATDR